MKHREGQRYGAAGLGLVLLLASAARAEPASTMQSAAEAARTVPAGVWQGTWTLRRDDPRLTTLAGQRALTLTVFHDRGSPTAEVDWLADRALCEPPTGEPCEWVGQHGSATAVAVTPQGLTAVLRVSADEADPLVLHLAPPKAGRALGHALSARGDSRFALTAQRAP